jgi:glycosyltransferase involved in cell wall biosynthesis
MQSSLTIPDISPANTTFAFIAFEGPDRYALAGGLGMRITELTEALAHAGYETHLFFVGSPDLPDHEQPHPCLHLWRVCQEVSRKYPAGVYQGEDEKIEAFERTLPPLLLERVMRPAHQQGKLLVIGGEDWHTASTMASIADVLYWQGLRAHAILLWNANSIFGFERVDWGRLTKTVTVTAVSRYMKQKMATQKIKALVIPNGIPERLLDPISDFYLHQLRLALPQRLLLPKFARFDPDKSWLPAIHAVAKLKAAGERPLLLARGGVEGYGLKVLAEMDSVGLRRRDLHLENPTVEQCINAIGAIQHDTDVVLFRFFVPEAFQRLLYRTADAVLANSVHEPFGLVGLEVMAAQGIAFVGATGEEYAQHLNNGISLDTDDANEIVSYLLYLRRHPELIPHLRREGYATARLYTWSHAIAKIITKLQYLALIGAGTWPQRM